MKILRNEEREAHVAHISSEGAKGAFYGALLSLGIFSYIRLTYPVKFRQMSSSVKTCVLVLPTVATVAFFADQGSVDFDREIHKSKENEERMLSEFRAWQKKSETDKFMSSVCTNKYKVITGTWLASSYGSYYHFNNNSTLGQAEKLLNTKKSIGALSAAALLTTATFYIKDRAARKQATEEARKNRE